MLLSSIFKVLNVTACKVKFSVVCDQFMLLLMPSVFADI